MSKTVYFVRHGECKANIDGVIAGASDDSPLTETGKQQATETANSLAGITFDLVVTSPMSRAKDTAEIIAKNLGITSDKIIVNNDFTEKDVGRFSGQPKATYFEFEKSGGEVGELTGVMQQRVRNGLSWLKEQTFTNALVITHNGTVRMIRTVLDDLPAKEFANLPQLKNGEFLKIEFS